MEGCVLRLVFFGTPSFALPSLTLCLERHEVLAVVSRTADPKQSPVVALAVARGVPVLAPSTWDSASLERLLALPFSVGVVAAYGQLLPTPLLKRGLLNVHPSLLPRWRGANPIRRALWCGDEVTGVSLIWLTEQLDAGPIVWQESTPIGPEEDYGSLAQRLAQLGAAGLATVLERLERGETLTGRPQREAEATYASRLRPEEEWIAEDLSAEEAWRRLRALAPEPGGKIELGGRLVLVRRVRFLPEERLSPGSLRVVGEELWQGRAGGTLAFQLLQPAGRKTMSGAAFARGYLRRATQA